jgi:hypothetical protein
VPNTYYLKLEGVTLLTRLRRGVPALVIVVVRNLLPLLLAALFVPRPARWPDVRRPVAFLAALVSVQAAYSAYVGGDVWESAGYTNRYLTTMIPALSILAAAGLRELSLAGGDQRRRFAALLLATLALRLMLEAGWTWPTARVAERHDVVRAPSKRMAGSYMGAGGRVARVGIRHRVPVQTCRAT